MLFDFKTVQAVQFWMKNTLIPLDMVFIAPDGRVVAVVRNAVPHEHAGAPERADHVLACWRSPAAARPSSISNPATRFARISSTPDVRASTRPLPARLSMTGSLQSQPSSS